VFQMYRAPAEPAFGCLEAAEADRWHESPAWVSAILAFLARFLAPQRFFLAARKPRVPTFSVSTLRFSELKLLEDRCFLTCPLQTWILPSCPLRSLQALEFPLTGTFCRILAWVPYCGTLLRL
jgi:hypothetical protein